MLDIKQIAQLAKKFAEAFQAGLLDRLKLQEQNAEFTAKIAELSELLAEKDAKIAEMTEADKAEDADYEAQILNYQNQAKQSGEALTAVRAEKEAAEKELNDALAEIQALLDQ